MNLQYLPLLYGTSIIEYNTVPLFLVEIQKYMQKYMQFTELNRSANEIDIHALKHEINQ